MLEILVSFLLLHSSAQTPWVEEIKPVLALDASNLAITTSYTPPTEVLKATTTEASLISAIAKCESNNDPKAKNKNSSASGRFQFIRGTWEHYGKELWKDGWIKKDVFNYEDNTELATYVVEKYGTKDWDESKFCWNK